MTRSLIAVAIALAFLVVRLLPTPTTTTAVADTTPPKITRAAMQDTDGDRRADRVLLTYSEKVIFDGSTGPGPFAVAGYKIKGAGHTHQGTTVTLVLIEKAAPDPAAKPAVTYTPFACNAPGVVDLAGNEAIAQTFTGTKSASGAASRPAAAAAVAPKITAAAMGDADDDGKADKLTLTYSTKVSFPGEPTGSKRFTVDGYRILKVKKALASKTLEIVLQEKAKPDPKSEPDVSYCAPPPGSGQKPVRGSTTDGRPAPTQVFKGTKSTSDRPKVPPIVRVRTKGKLALGSGGALVCTGAFIKVDVVRVPGDIISSGGGTCVAEFTRVPRGATVEISILGSAFPTPAVGGCETFDMSDFEETVDGDLLTTDDITMTAAGFGACVL